MDKRILAIVAVVIILIVAYVLLAGGGKQAEKTTTKAPVNGTTTITVPPYITTYNVQNRNFSNITNINLKYLYSGANEINGYPCGSASRADTYTYDSRINASKNFTIDIYVYSSNCNLTVTGMSINQNGFLLQGTAPQFPYQLPADSQILVAVRIKAPPFNFSGPLSMTVSEK